MTIWIDVENASGARYGDGPIITASEWQSTRRLDGAGTFSFVMPASDPRSNLLAHKRIVRCWRADASGVREVGGGIIDAITVTPGDPTLLQVSGDDLLRELANRTVGDLDLFQATEYTPLLRIVTVWPEDPSTTVNITPPATVTLSDYNPLRYLYVGYTRPFSKITLTLGSTVNAKVSDTLNVQYYNPPPPPAEPEGRVSWHSLGSLVNNTAAPGPDMENEPDRVYPFGVTGARTIEFDPPQEWTSFNGYYYIRFSDEGVDLDDFIISSATVTIVEPVSDALQRIMALAPPGWSLDPGGKYATALPVYMTFAGESILSALVMLAEQTGEHFTLSPSGRRVWWQGVVTQASGIRAVQASEPGDNIMLISRLQRSANSYDLYTRAYAYGGGEGVGRLTMEKATRDVSSYTIGPGGAYLEADAAVAIYGRIDHREDHPDIVPANASEAQTIHAANTLFDRVYNALRRKCQVQQAYALEVVPSVYEVWPGQSVYVDYHEWVDGWHAVNIAADLVVLENTVRITQDGLRLVALQVATVDFAPTDDYHTVARLIGQTRQDRSKTLPATGISSASAGTPATINVANGRITSIGRVNPVDDGWYTLSALSKIKITNGIVTKVQVGGP
jgi:hypothetical protein